MTIRDELHRYLDDELPREELPEDLHREAAAWRTFLEDVRAAGPAGAPAGLESHVMRAVLGEGVRRWWKRAAAWWLRPRPVRISPLAAGLAAAAVLALALALPFGGAAGPRGPSVATGGGPETMPATAPGGGSGEPAPTQTIYVKFVLEAPAARSVSLAGNFNEWSPDIPLHDHNGDGVWTATVSMRPGVHEYMFVVDGSSWVTDPNAERYEEDGFGNRNAVLAIAGPAGT